jgi:hypothetical protein
MIERRSPLLFKGAFMKCCEEPAKTAPPSKDNPTLIKDLTIFDKTFNTIDESRRKRRLRKLKKKI